MAVTVGELCDAIMLKIGHGRKLPGAGKLDKTELLHLNAYLDLVGVRKASERTAKEALARQHGG